jgi:hypothetical protein
MGVFVDKDPELHSQGIVLLAHSRGGIVGRHYMNDYVMTDWPYTNLRGGERINVFFTLATPHLGSPLADEIWDRFSFDYNHWDLTAFALCDVSFRKWVFKNSYRFLQWSDSDSESTNDLVTWDSACAVGQYSSFLMSNVSSVSKLNAREVYHNKIIAFGGNRYKRVSVDWYAFGPVVLLYPTLFDLPNSLLHLALGYLSSLLAEMPIIPNGYLDGEQGISIDDSYRPFQANDGMVPLISALFLKPGSGKLFGVNLLGKVKYDTADLESKKQVRECIIFDSVDHLDWLTKPSIRKKVIAKLREVCDW